MGSFSEKRDTTALIHLHSGAVTVLVEGKSDEQFLERMFPGMKAEIRFESVGGCTAMTARLKEERSINPKVFGLIDRDSLKRENRWSELFEIDDNAFAKATHIDGLYVLTRWEIENYLFDFVAVQKLFDNWSRSAPATNADTLLDNMIAAACAELHVTAAWCTAHSHGLAEQDCPVASCIDPQALPASVFRWIEEKLPEAVDQHQKYVASVTAFDPGEGVNKPERLIGLLRMVDGKRFLERLRRRWLKLDRNPSFQLADNVGGIVPRSDDLYRLVKGFLNQS